MLANTAILTALLVILLNLLLAVYRFGRLESKVEELGREFEILTGRIDDLPCQEGKEPCPQRRLITPAT